MGIAVIVLCFVDKNALSNIQDKLGNGMTRAPFAVIVVSIIRFFFLYLLVFMNLLLVIRSYL